MKEQGKNTGTLTEWFSSLEFIAEDLGFATPEVAKLLADSKLPGMKVIEFAFSPDGTSEYLPHRYPQNCVCYTGTHDNSPLMLWQDEADPKELAFAKKYLGLNQDEGFNRGLIRGGMSSNAKLFVAQMQDYLELGSGSRMNLPGTLGGNWEWRMIEGEANDKLAKEIAEITRMYDRIGQ